MIRRFFVRGTRGSGPPNDLAFREISYSDADGLLHVGRPNGTVRSFAQSIPPTWASITEIPTTFPPTAHTHPPLTIDLTPINGYQPLAGWPNDLKVFPSLGMAHVRIAVTRTTAPAEALAVVQWTPDYAAIGNSFGASMANMGATHSNALQFAFVAGNSLAWVSATAAAPGLGYLLSAVWFPYA